MTQDLLRYLSGEIPGGIFLLAGVLLLFAGVWYLIWRATGFWEHAFFNKVLGRGIYLIVLLYLIFWFSHRPAGIPTRVVIWAQVPADYSGESWRASLIADAITARLWSSHLPIVPQTSDYIPALDRIAPDAKGLESRCKLLRARWIVKVIPPAEASAPVAVHLLEFSSGKYHEKAKLKGRGGAMVRDAADLAQAVAEGLGDPNRVIYRAGESPEQSDSLYQEFYFWSHRADTLTLDTALAHLRRLAASDSLWIQPRQEIARLLLRYRPGLGEAEILGQVQGTPKVNPDDIASFLLMGRRALYLRRWDEAEAAFKVALSRNPDDPEIYFYLSRLDESRYHDIQIKSQVRLLKQALWLAPGYEAARLALAEAEWRIDERAVVADLLKEGMEIDPTSTALLLRLSAKEIEMSRFADAAIHCRRILSVHPGDAEALYNLGIASIWLKDYDTALASLDSAYKTGGIVDAIYYRGVAYVQQGKWAEAVQAFQERAARPQRIDDPSALAARRSVERIRREIINKDTTTKNPDDLRGPEFFFPGK